MIVIIGVVNVRGTCGSANLQNVTTALKVAAILVMGSALLWFGKGFATTSALPTQLSTGRLFSGFGLAMISVLWAYEGWQYATSSARETLQPERIFPLAFFAGSAALIGLYLFANCGYVAALGPDGVANSNRVAATAISTIAGGAAAKLVALMILTSMFSAANAIVLTSPRDFFAMAKDGLFFKRLEEVHPRFGTPTVAVIASTAWAAVLATTGIFEQLLTYAVFVGWIFYALAASIFVYRKHVPDAERPNRVPGYPFTPLVFIVAAAALVANTIVTQPLRTALGLGIFIVGVPAYFFWRGPKSMTHQEGS